MLPPRHCTKGNYRRVADLTDSILTLSFSLVRLESDLKTATALLRMWAPFVRAKKDLVVPAGTCEKLLFELHFLVTTHL